MRLKLTYTKIISIECSLTNTDSWKHMFSRFCDSFQGFHGRRESDPRVKLPVRMQIGIKSPTVRGDFLESRGSPVPSRVRVVPWFQGCVQLTACRARETFVSSRPNSPVSVWQWRTEEVSSYPKTRVLSLQFTRYWTACLSLDHVWSGEGCLLEKVYTCEKRPSWIYRIDRSQEPYPLCQKQF